MTHPQMTITGPVMDAADPIALAEFYERLLGWQIVEKEGPRPGHPPDDGWARIRSPQGTMKIEFQWEQHYEPPTWPAAAGEQQMMMHLDIEGSSRHPVSRQWSTCAVTQAWRSERPLPTGLGSR